ncbi:MAG: hypothetical protein ACOCT9_00640 [archaeon]
METIKVRIQLSTWRKLRRVFPGKKDETAAQYFERLNKFLKDISQNVRRQ